MYYESYEPLTLYFDAVLAKCEAKYETGPNMGRTELGAATNGHRAFRDLKGAMEEESRLKSLPLKHYNVMVDLINIPGPIIRCRRVATCASRVSLRHTLWYIE
jgi:hypothetical protein